MDHSTLAAIQFGCLSLAEAYECRWRPSLITMQDLKKEAKSEVFKAIPAKKEAPLRSQLKAAFRSARRRGGKRNRRKIAFIVARNGSRQVTNARRHSLAVLNTPSRPPRLSREGSRAHLKRMDRGSSSPVTIFPEGRNGRRHSRPRPRLHRRRPLPPSPVRAVILALARGGGRNSDTTSIKG